MRITITLLLSILLLTACRSKVQHVWNYEVDQLEMLNGPVKQIKVSHTLQGLDQEHYVINFDEHGLMKSSVLKVFSKGYTPRFDSENNLIQITGKYSNAAKHEDTATYVLVFARDGRLIKTKRLDDDGYWYDGVRYKYNSQADIVEQKKIFTTHREPMIDRYLYDNNHRLVRRDEFEAEVPEITVTMKYLTIDTHDNWLKRIESTHGYDPLDKWLLTDTITRSINYY